MHLDITSIGKCYSQAGDGKLATTTGQDDRWEVQRVLQHDNQLEVEVDYRSNKLLQYFYYYKYLTSLLNREFWKALEQLYRLGISLASLNDTSSKEICWKSNHSRALTSYTVLIVCFLRCCWVTWRCYSTNLLPHECWFHIVARVAWRMSATKTWFWWGRWPWAWAAQKNQKQLQYSWKRSVDWRKAWRKRPKFKTSVC